MAEGDPRSHVSASHPPNVPNFFFTGHSDHAGHARKNLPHFESVWIFYDFPGQKPLKYCPDVTQLAFVVGFRSFWPWGAQVGPHTHWQKLCAFRETAQALAVERGGFDMAGGDPRSHVSAWHPPNVPNFFSRATVTMQGTHAKKSRFKSVWNFYDFAGRKPLKYCPDVTQLAFVV